MPDTVIDLAELGGGPVLVLGGPGTGKTELIAKAAVNHVVAGGSPLVLAASRADASELRNQIALGARGTTQLTVTTVHSLARSVLDGDLRLGGWRLLTAPEQEFRVRELLSSGVGAYWPSSLRQALETRGFARQVRAVLARARQLGLDPADVARFGVQAGLPVWTAVGEFFAEYLDVLDAEQVLDYAELVHRARLRLEDDAVLAKLRERFDLVLIDDVTELDPAQVGLVRALVPQGGDIWATADPHAAVNTFRGAHPRIAAEFAGLFPDSDGKPAQVIVLAQGYRAGGELAAALHRVASRLPQLAVTGGRVAPLAAERPGVVEVLVCDTEAAETAAIVSRIRRARLESGIDYGEMAVLVRASGPLLAQVARGLAAAGVPVDQAADEIALAEDAAVRPLLWALEVALRGELRPVDAVRLLGSPLVGLDAVAQRRLARQWRAHCAPGQENPAGPDGALAAAMNHPDWLNQATTAEQRRLAEFADRLAAARSAIQEGKRADEIAWGLWQGSRWPDRLRAEALAGNPGADRDLDAVAAFFDLAAEVAGAGAAGVRLLLGTVAAQQIPADRTRESRLGSRGVRLLTAHRARGRQWRFVVVAGVREGTWPVGRRLSAVLEPERLLSAGIGSPRDPREHLADERRLFFVACSRAVDQLIVSCAAGAGSDAARPSRFLADLGVEPSKPELEVPVTLPELIGELRQVLGAAEVAPAWQGVAARELAQLAEARDEVGHPLIRLADPQRWWGVHQLSSPSGAAEAEIRLGPSQIDALLTCPRKYFLSRSVGAEASRSPSAPLGSVLHLLVERLATGDLDSSEVGEQLELAWRRLRFDTGWYSEVERVEAAAAVARFAAWQAGREHTLVSAEAPFEFSLDLAGHAVVLAGKVDRLERTADGRLVVVDFKTGRAVPSAREVAAMDQLGVYQLAIEAGAFDHLGVGDASSAGASVVYLREPARRPGLPKELTQEALASRPHLGDDPAELDFPTWVHHRIAQAASIVAEGCFDAAPGAHCRSCGFADSCPASGRGEQVIR